MSEFKVIETQEQLDAIIGERLKRERTTLEEKFKDYLSPDDFADKTKDLQAQITGLNAQITESGTKYKELEEKMAEKDAQIKKYETASVKSRIAHELGLPYESVTFIQGEDEESIKKSADTLKGMIGSGFVPPLADQGQKADSTDAAFKSMLEKL